MGSREFLHQASTQVVDALDAGKPVKTIGDGIYEEYRSRYPDRTPDIDAHYFSMRRTRQVFNMAVCEIAWRGALASIDAHRQSTGSLVPQIGLSFVERDPQNSPTLHRFMATMQHWFGGALQRTFDDLRQKSGKDGPYDDIHTVYSEYIQAYENWRWNSSHPRALVARGWNDYPMAPEESIHRIVRENCAIIAWKVVGVGLVLLSRKSK